MGHVLYTKPAIQILGQYIRKQYGVHLSFQYSNGIWKPDHLTSNLYLTIWIPNKFDIQIPTVVLFSNGEPSRVVKGLALKWRQKTELKVSISADLC